MYSFIKIWLRLALNFYCRKVEVSPAYTAQVSKPAILASNHANSFFDALIIAAYYPEKIYFLARGDAFNKKWAAWILKKINLIPIYRLEEGKQHLGNNEHSFSACMEVFKKGGTILIFPEGLSKHEVTLRPLRKGAARLAYQAWKESNISDLVVQPVSLTYNSFEIVPKDVKLHYASCINNNHVKDSINSVFYNKFNTLLKERLEENAVLNNNTVSDKPNSVHIKLNTVLLAIPAFLGYITQRWFYIFWKGVVAKKTKDTVFYDSVLFASMMLTYPILILLVTILTVCITGNKLFWLLFLALPFTAWSYKEYRSL